MGINYLWLTNGEKTFHVIQNGPDGPRAVYERLSDIPESIRDFAHWQEEASGGPIFCEPDTARIYGVQDIFYPDWPKPCGNPNRPGRDCVAEVCSKYGGPGGG